MNPGRRLKCPDCGWWGGHAMTCPEMSKPNPRPGIREKDLFEWADVDPSDPAMAERLADMGGAAGGAAAGAGGPADGHMGYKSGGSAEAPTTVDSATLEAEAAGMGHSMTSDATARLLAQDIEALETTNPDQLAMDAPDMTNVGSNAVKAEFEKCTLCKIKIPAADAETYTAEKRCPISRSGCPYTVAGDAPDVEDLGKSTKAGPSGVGAKSPDRLKEYVKATLATGAAPAGPANLADYVDVSVDGDNSVRKQVLHPGVEGGPTLEAGAKVVVHYVGTFPESGKEFDSSRRRNAPFSFTLGEGVIAGWSEGVATMARGEKSSFFLAPNKAYGEQGSPFGGIPPNAPLLFEIELLGWTDPKSAESADAPPPEAAADAADPPVSEAMAARKAGIAARAEAKRESPRGRGRSGASVRGSPRNSCELQIMVVAAMGILVAIYAAHSL